MITNAVCASFSALSPSPSLMCTLFFPFLFTLYIARFRSLFSLSSFSLHFSYSYFFIAVSRYLFFTRKNVQWKQKIQRNSFQVPVFAYTFVFTQNPSQRLLPAIIKLEQILIDAGLCRKSFVERTLFGEKFQSPIWIRQKKKKKKKNGNDDDDKEKEVKLLEAKYTKCFAVSLKLVQIHSFRIEWLLHVCREFVNIFISIASTNYRIWWEWIQRKNNRKNKNVAQFEQ